MKDSQILSAFPERPGQTAAAAVPPLVFDACQIGVVLRTVLLAEAVAGVLAMFGAQGYFDWVARFALATGGVLPALLAWLVATCALKRVLARLALPWQFALACGLGALAGDYGCAMLQVGGLVDAAPWLASAAAGALLAALVVNARLQRVRDRVPADIAARLAELQSRIRPHFLFNSLNSAIALVRAEPARAEALLEDLSDLFRHALQEHDAAVTLADEVTLARRYLDIEAVRFGDRLRVQWQLDPAADGARLPPLILQPLVENAVRHGVEPSADGAQLTIRTERRGSTALIKVDNTVPAGPGARGAGVALRNVRARLVLMHDVQVRFQCGLKDGMYRVRIEVPL